MACGAFCGLGFFAFMQNNSCEYFPCHKVSKNREKDFNCLFCYCPLYLIDECGGDYVYLDNGVKDCSECTIPHFEYGTIITKLEELIYNNK